MSLMKLPRRSANYSKPELDCLLKYLEDNPDLVSVTLGGKYTTPDDFRIAWDEIADKITSIAGYLGIRRSGQEIKRKWSDLKSRVKAKAAALALEGDKSEGTNAALKLSPVEERVLAIISRDIAEQSQRFDSSAHGSKWPSVKVFSFQTESTNSEDRMGSEYGEGEEASTTDNADETEILQEIKLSGSDDKKRRISEAFSSTSAAEKKALGLKRLRVATEEEQLQMLCNSQIEVNADLRSIKDMLKRCQQSIEKIALLKRAELRLKCAKYGVEFEDLFD